MQLSEEEEAETLKKFRVNIYAASTIKAPARREAKAMWIVEFVRDANPFDPVIRKGFIEFGETTEDAVILTALAEALGILTKECEICIFTKCRGVFSTLETRRYEGWRANKWRNSYQNMVKNAELWEILIGFLEKHTWSASQESHSFEALMESELKKWPKV